MIHYILGQVEITAFHIWVITIAIPTILMLKLLIDEIDDNKREKFTVMKYLKLTRYLENGDV